jgi:hypothetical protein
MTAVVSGEVITTGTRSERGRHVTTSPRPLGSND